MEAIHNVLSTERQPSPVDRYSGQTAKSGGGPSGRYTGWKKAMVRGHAVAAMRARRMILERTILQSSFCSRVND